MLLTWNNTGGAGGISVPWSSTPSALLPPGFSLTRASTGTYFDSAGLLQTAAIDAARGTYRYNGSSWVFDGTIVEAAATQLVTPTASIRDLTNAAWAKTNMTTALTSTGADGSANSATRCTATAGNATVLQTLVAAATSRTVSFLIRRVTGTGNIELTQDGATYTNIATQLNSSVYTLVQLNATQLNASFGIRIVTSGDAIDVDFAQFEAGSAATSRIATAGATRSADVLTAPTSGLLVNAQGFAEMRFRNIAVPSTASVVLSSLTTGANGIPLYNAPSGSCSIYDGTATRISALSFPLTAGTLVSFASSWGNSQCFVARDGAVSSALTFDNDMNFGSSLRIGDHPAVASEPMSLVLQSLRLGTRAATDSELAGWTT